MMNKFSFFSVSVYSRLMFPVSIRTLRPGQIETLQDFRFYKLTKAKP
jgi:hypothetical protein